MKSFVLSITVLFSSLSFAGEFPVGYKLNRICKLKDKNSAIHIYDEQGSPKFQIWLYNAEGGNIIAEGTSDAVTGAGSFLFNKKSKFFDAIIYQAATGSFGNPELIFEAVDNNGYEDCSSYYDERVQNACREANAGVVGVARLKIGKDKPVQTLQYCENFN